LVIDLIFSTSDILGFHDTNITILDDAASRLASDHNPIKMSILFAEEELKPGKEKIDEWSEEEDLYVAEVVERMDALVNAVGEIQTKEKLNGVMEGVGMILDDTWKKYAHASKPSRWGKNWWNDKCSKKLKNIKNK
jgi:hypothetical protein